MHFRFQRCLVSMLVVALMAPSVLRSQALESRADHDRAKSLCESLHHTIVSATDIALPTTGARVRIAKLYKTGSAEYCKVLGDIGPVDQTAQDIRFEVNFPTSWNGKSVHFGGAVFDGSLVYSDGVKRPSLGVKDGPTPLQAGFLTFGSDSGHHKHHFFLPDVINILDSSFASSEEEQRNFSQDALKKTRDVMVSLAIHRYGHAPIRNFFLGSSSGGHEALMVVQRWPTDYDGVLSGYPSWDGVELLLQFIRTSRALYTKGGFLSTSTTKLLAKSVLSACDALDGVKDGLVSNVEGCRFDPAALLCSNKKRSGCLSPQQLITVQTFATEQRTQQPVWHGIQSVSGYNVLAGADLTGSLGLFHHAVRHPKIFLSGSQYTIGSRGVRSFFAKDPHFDALQLDPESGAPFAKDLFTSSQHYDASDVDLSGFAAHGGKLLLVHGTADVIIPTKSSVMYYERVETAMGEPAVARFMRLYLIPGFGHGAGRFEAGFDALGMLDRWIDTGELELNPVVKDQGKSGKGRSRPLCAFPGWAEYKGQGDPKSSLSFHCSTATAEK